MTYAWPRVLQQTFYGAGAPHNLATKPAAWLGAATFPPRLRAAARRRARAWNAVVSHWAVPSGLVGAAVRKHRPHLVVFHSGDVHLLRRLPGRRRLTTRLARGATSWMFTSRALRDEVVSWLPRGHAHPRLVVQAMGVDEPPRPARPTRPGGRLRVLSLGRLTPLKNVDGLLRGIAGSGEHEHIALTVAGEGPERARLLRLAAELGVDSKMLGVVSGPAKWARYAEADVFVLPSRPYRGRTEGVPTAVLEAAMAGCALVLSRVGGLPELFTDEVSALLIEPGDDDALGRALRRLRNDGALRRRLGEAARAVGEAHRWSRIGPRVARLLVEPASR